MRADMDAALAGKLLQWLGDRAGHGTAGLLDPFRRRQPMRRSLQREFGKDDQRRGIGAPRGGVDQADHVGDIVIDDRPRAGAIRGFDGELAFGLDARRPPRLNGHRPTSV